MALGGAGAIVTKSRHEIMSYRGLGRMTTSAYRSENEEMCAQRTYLLTSANAVRALHAVRGSPVTAARSSALAVLTIDVRCGDCKSRALISSRRPAAWARAAITQARAPQRDCGFSVPQRRWNGACRFQR